MSNSTAATDTRAATNEAIAAANALKAQLDSYVTNVGGEGGHEAAAAFAALSAAMTAPLAQLTTIGAAQDDTFAQNT